MLEALVWLGNVILDLQLRLQICGRRDFAAPDFPSSHAPTLLYCS